VDFKKICYFYVTNFTRLKNREAVRRHVSASYHLLQYKRKKLKSGSTTFVFKQMFYGDWLIAQWFEMEFSNQAGASDPQKGVERTMVLLEWSWDLKIVYSSESLDWQSSITSLHMWEITTTHLLLEATRKSLSELESKPFSLKLTLVDLTALRTIC